MDFITLFIALVVAVAAIEFVALGVHGTAFLANTRDVGTTLWLWLRYFAIILWNAWRRRQLRRMKRDINGPCPACGHRRGTIVARKEIRLLIHRCLICDAQWGESFVVDPAVWVQEAPSGG